MDDTDLSGLDFESARAYVLEFLTSLKATDKALASAREELVLWKNRVELAVSKGLADLEAGARAKVSEIEGRLQTLEAERAEIAAKVSRMREKLPVLKAAERSVDVDLLLAELQMATGEAMDPDASKLDSDLKSEAANVDLEALKRKMRGDA